MLGTLIVCVLAVLAGSAAAEDGWIAGKVSEGTTGVAGATVSVVNGTQTATTDANGNYNLTVPVGTYSIKVTKTGYTDKTVTDISVTNNTTTTQNVAIVKATGTLSGYVNNSAGTGIFLASVKLSTGQSTSTGSNGAYSFTGLLPGTVTINVTADVLDEYLPDTATATIVAGQTVTKDFKLKLVTYVTVYVKGPTLLGIPLPLEGATVTFDSQTGTSDGLGMVRFNTTVGSHTVKIKAKDYKDYSTTVTAIEGPNTLTAPLKKTSGSNEETGILAGLFAMGILLCILIIVLPIILIIALIVWLVRRKKSNPPAPAPPMQAPPPQTPPPPPPQA